MSGSAAVEDLTVRQAGPADFDDLLPLFERFYRDEGFESAIAGVAGNLRALLGRDDTVAFVARAEGKAVGAAAASSSFGLEDGAYAELEDLFVEPDWRARGVASALVEAVDGWARSRGFASLEIVMTPHAQAKDDLAPWYEKRDFLNTGRVIYERRLDGS